MTDRPTSRNRVPQTTRGRTDDRVAPQHRETAR